MKKNKVITTILLVIMVICGMMISVSAYNTEMIYDAYKATEIIVDGKLDDWDGYEYTYVLLPTAEKQVSYFDGYGGTEDLSGIFWFAWSEEGLYMASKCYDNIYHTVDGALGWTADSIQFVAGDGPEFVIVDKVYATLRADTGILGVESVELVTKPFEGGRVYEMFFPWGTMGGSSAPPSDGIFPFCVLYNESDGGSRLGWIELTPGIATGKNSKDFAALKLLDAVPKKVEGTAKHPEIKDISKKVETQAQTQTVVIEVKTNITYPDVATHWAREYIDYGASNGVLRGMGELYVPEGTMTRGEFVATLVRAVGLDCVPYKGGIADIKAAHWCSKYVQAAVDGMLLPSAFLENGALVPDRKITREEMLALTANAAAQMKQAEIKGVTLDFKDAYAIKKPFRSYLEYARSIELVNGNGNGTLRPKDTATRAEVATVIYKLMKAVSK